MIDYWNGRFYALGPEADSAAITATAYHTTMDPISRQTTIHEQKTFTYDRVSAGRGAWSFVVPMDGPDSLPARCWDWYTLEQGKNATHRTLFNGPVDVTLRLYGDDGTVLTELSSTMYKQSQRAIGAKTAIFVLRRNKVLN